MSESKAQESFETAIKAQHAFKVDTIAVLFEDGVVIKLNEHKWVEWQGTPPIRQRVTTFKPSPEQQARFREVLVKLHEL